LFSSSRIVGRPEQFKVEQVIAAWKEMLLEMAPGEERRIWVPKSLCPPANQEVPEGPLVFDLELWAIMDGAALQQQAAQGQGQQDLERAQQP
jgi:FKBP-type peptidyl-prolyl cis-trans isomerase